MNIEITAPAPRWLIAEALDERAWLIHTHEPAFIAEVFDPDDEDAGIFIGFSVALRNRYSLGNFTVWGAVELPPLDRGFTDLCMEAGAFIDDYFTIDDDEDY